MDLLPARVGEDAGHGADLDVQAMNGGDADKQKPPTDEALNAAISAYLADPPKPAVLEIGAPRRGRGRSGECLQHGGAGA